MDTLLARLSQPAPMVIAALVAALVLLVPAVALASAAIPGIDPMRLAITDASPFRWS